MNYQNIAKEIIENVGGDSNIANLTHCATRLRFNLIEPKFANKENLRKIDGVLTVVTGAGQLQVVIGSQVADVYKEIEKVATINNTANKMKADRSVSVLNEVFDVISKSFSPLLGALSGAGMLKALLVILTSLGWISTSSGTYFILSGAGNSIFYFLPIFLGISVAIRLGANGYVGGAIGAALLEPNLTNLLTEGGSTTFLGIPAIVVDYSSTVFPVFIAICIYSFVDKLLKKVIHKELQFFLIPMLSLMLIVPLTVLIFGPFGTYVGDGIGAIIEFLSTKSGLLAGALIGGGWTVLTLFGLQWGIIPLIIANFASTGSDPLLSMVAGANFSQIGIAVGFFFITKDQALKRFSGTAILPGAFAGVTEPIIYGLLLPYRKTFIYAIIAGAIGGAINGALGSKALAFGMLSFLTLPAYSPFLYHLTGALTAFGLGLIAVVIFGYENKRGNIRFEEKK